MWYFSTCFSITFIERFSVWLCHRHLLRSLWQLCRQPSASLLYPPTHYLFSFLMCFSLWHICYIFLLFSDIGPVSVTFSFTSDTFFVCFFEQNFCPFRTVPKISLLCQKLYNFILHTIQLDLFYILFHLIWSNVIFVKYFCKLSKNCCHGTLPSVICIPTKSPKGCQRSMKNRNR